MDLAHFVNKYKSRQPWDFSSNPTKVAYIDEDKIHTEVGERSDIRIHTDFLTFLAHQCENIVEFGVRNGESTIALLTANPKSLISVDINPSPLTSELNLSNWKFKLMNSCDPNLDIGQPDLLFIDSKHTFNHCSQELKMHAYKVKKYLVFHDSYSCPDILQAIYQFLELDKEWKMVYNTTVNHGLIVLQRHKNG